MRDFSYVKDFQKLGFGMFVHFGLYSTFGCGEWSYSLNKKIKKNYFDKIKRFKVRKDWAKKLVSTAVNAGCKYINITTRHHEGFSLYDTCGLSNFDAVHSACGRDLIREFVDECNLQGIVPFFYHTCFDWHYQHEYCLKHGIKGFDNQQEYEKFFENSDYLDYWHKSIELLCKNYGKIGGFWFDGIWACPNANWRLDELYALIRRYQPTAMIINNTGLYELGRVGHYEIDSVTFERGAPSFADCSDRIRAGEMCQTLNDHWGYTSNSINYKTIKEIIENLIDCRAFNANLLLNIGPKGDGSLRDIDVCFFDAIGQWIKANKSFIYGVSACDIKAENAIILKDDESYYAIIKGVPMSSDPNVQKLSEKGKVTVFAQVTSAEWLDSGEKIKVKNNSFDVKPFDYGCSYTARVAKLNIAK